MSQSEKLQKKPDKKIKRNRFTCPSVHGEFIRVMFIISDQQKQGLNFFQTEAQHYQVSDQMTIKQLKQKWHKNNKLSKGLNQQFTDYVFMWNLKYALKDEYKISKIKQMVGLTKFDDECIFKVCDEWDCHLKQDEASLDYGTFIQKNQNKYDITFKILTKDHKDIRYFYLPCRFDCTLSILKQNIAKYFQSNYQKKDIKYRLLMKKASATHQFKDLMQKKDQDIQNTLKETQYNFDFTDCKFYQKDKPLLIKRVLTPGHTVQIRFDSELGLPVKALHNHNPHIKIIYFQENQNSIMKKKDFIIQLSEIQEMKVETILFELQIVYPHFTSLCSGSFTLRPEEKFQKLALLPNFQKEDTIQLKVIPENFLYYKQIVDLQNLQKLQKSQKIIDLKKILEIIAEKAQQFDSEDPKYKPEIPLKDRVLTHLDNLTADIFSGIKNPQHKNQQFLKPIVLYTSDYMYSDLNLYLRENSISRILNAIFLEWHYPFCEKLIKSLIKLRNFHGKVYRASTEYDYNYKQGDIFEWNGFTSTSKQIKQVDHFLQNDDHGVEPELCYIFQIQTSSGKQITQYSAQKRENEILIFPYTRFKVLQVNKNYNYQMQNGQRIVTFVKLLQIQIPKKIPGNIVVWIDGNISQNLQTFQEIFKQKQLEDFDLIQLVNNDHFKAWLEQYRQVIQLEQIKIYFISSTDPNSSQEGIKTLQIIRRFSQTALMVYYIENVQKVQNNLQSKGLEKDPNVKICDTKASLSKIFGNSLPKNKQPGQTQSKDQKIGQIQPKEQTSNQILPKDSSSDQVLPENKQSDDILHENEQSKKDIQEKESSDKNIQEIKQ